MIPQARGGVRTRAGCPLAWTLRGEGLPALFIQGVGLHGDGWLPQVEGLSGRIACLTFDNRGMGRSVPAGERITVEGMAEDALAVLDAAGWSAAHVVGHSLGGAVALQLALTARARVKSLSLLCTFARGREAGASARMAWLGLRSRVGTRAMRRAAFLQMVLPPRTYRETDAAARAALAREMEPLFGHDLADQPPVVLKQLMAMRAFDATPRLGELAGTAALVMSATHDPVAPPRLGRAIAAGLPGAVWVELPDASHGVTIHDAPAVNRLLLGHMLEAEKLAGGGAGTPDTLARDGSLTL